MLGAAGRGVTADSTVSLCLYMLTTRLNLCTDREINDRVQDPRDNFVTFVCQNDYGFLHLGLANTSTFYRGEIIVPSDGGSENRPII